MDAQIIHDLVALYREIDEKTASLAGQTGLQCPSGCGRCCENPEVETTVLEVIPLALELWKRGEASQWLAKIEAVEAGGACVFYAPDPFIPENGRCSVYQWRPSLCRLFAFATVKNKHGEPELAACVRHKQTNPEAVNRARMAIANGLSAANFGEISARLADLDPGLGTRLLPINQAMKEALHRVGLMAQLLDDFGDGDRAA
jgi:Fe-S-cluster containining protein